MTGQNLPIEHDDDLADIPAGAGRFGRSWREEAACRSMDTSLFFPAGRTGAASDTTARAKQVCARCPVRASCLAFALVTNQRYGIWGGCNEDDLWRLRRRRRAQRRRLVADVERSP